MITARVERLSANQQDCVVLEADGVVILKAYASPDLTKLRVFLPELENFAQPLIRLDQRIIDFTRDGRAAQRLARRSR